MPTKEFNPHDPFDLVGAPVPLEDGLDTVEEMARCLIDEYLNMGWNCNGILEIFEKPAYRAPHTVYLQRGDEYVRGLIAEGQRRHDDLIQRLFGRRAREEV